jgi:hypothetical protein
VAVEAQVLLEEPLVLAGEQVELEEDWQVTYVDPEEVEDLGGSAEFLQKDAQQVGKAQSSCIGILEACPCPQ